MFDIGSWELLVVLVVGLVVIGPKELPAAIRTVRGVVGKLRGMAQEFRSGLDEVMREAELSELKDQVVSAIDPREFDDIEHSIRGDVWSPDDLGEDDEPLADIAATAGEDEDAEARRRRRDALTAEPQAARPVADAPADAAATEPRAEAERGA